MDIKIITTTKEVYITKDGKQFDNEQEAIQWQDYLAFVDKVNELKTLLKTIIKTIGEIEKITNSIKTIDKQ